MKKIILLFICLCALQVANTQNNSITFKEYINTFPLIEYPFINSFFSEETTPIKRPIKRISKELSDPFVRKYIYNTEWECDKEYYFGIMALARFETDTSHFYMVYIGNNAETGCDEKNYLITYSPYGKVIDTLLFMNSGTIRERVDRNDWGEYYYIEGTVVSNERVDIFYREHLGNVEYDNQKQRRRIKITKTSYLITSEGKFQKEASFIESDRIEEF